MHPTFVITTYTGDPSDKVVAGVLSVPTDEAKWSQRLRIYFKALNQYHARRRDTPLGIMMVTNLSGFPSSLSVLPVPDGDLRSHRAQFFVNENLKRLGCSGRTGMSFAYPNGATIAKYHQVYRTSDKNPLFSSVIELVKLCQTALHLFDVLEIDYVDGLLCDVTEKAVNDWWIGVGTDTYNTEPHDGILGPTTVAGLLGLLMGARNRLHALGSPVPKDPFDVDDMKRGISDFQKGQRMARTRRLDRRTLLRLHKASEKYANSEGGWRVPRAVKATVAELSGKGGEMLAEVVGRRDRAGVADIETTDMESFEQLAFGERCRWLWHGKPLKRTNLTTHGEASLEGRLFMKPEDQSGLTWSGRKQTSGLGPITRHEDEIKTETEPGSRASLEDQNGSPSNALHKTSMIKRATGLIDEGRSGFDRLKDAVHLRRHGTKFSRDDSKNNTSAMATTTSLETTTEDSNGHGVLKRPAVHRSISSPSESLTSSRIANAFDTRLDKESFKSKRDTSGTSTAAYRTAQLENEMVGDDRGSATDERGKRVNDMLKPLPSQTQIDELAPRSPLDGPEYHGIDLQEALMMPEESSQMIPPLLRRSRSYSAFLERAMSSHDPSKSVPRHLSFSIAAESTESSHIKYENIEDLDDRPPDQQLAAEEAYKSHLQRLRSSLASLSHSEATWTATQIDELTSLVESADQDVQFLESSLYEPSQKYAELRDLATAVLRDEKEVLVEGRRELETMAAKLDYEIENLKGKVDDVEVGVEDFERAVKAVEQRLQELEVEWKGGGGWSCVMS